MPVEAIDYGGSVEVRIDLGEIAVQDAPATVGISSAVIAGGIPYVGSYEFTPSADAQTIQTQSRVFDRDITINPIPSNYGLVTRVGSNLIIT